MRETTHLSPHGVFPDVCVSAWGLTVTYKIIGGNLIVERRSEFGSILLHSDEIDVSMPDSTFPRVVQAFGKTWIAYRAFRNGQESAVVREVLRDHLGNEHVLGPTWGNNPVCLSDTYVAWQEPQGVTNGMRLDTGEVSVLRHEILPPGIAHLNGNQVVFVDDNRLSEPGMLNPVRSGDLIVGEGFQEGLIARLPGKSGSVMGGECLTPRCAQIEPGTYAAVTWGPGRGSFLILFGPDDIEAAPVPDPVGKYVPPGPIDLNDIRELTGERLVAFYEQSGPPELHGAQLPPGNAEIAVRGYSVGTVRPRPVIAMDGNKHEIIPVFAIRLGSEEQNSEAGLRKLAELAWTRHREGWRTIVYWDALVRQGQSRMPPFWPDLPESALWEQNAFWWKWESPDRYAEDLTRATVEAVRRYGNRRVFLACQTHTTNLELIEDPSQAIPAIQELVVDLNLLGVSIFNNSGRDFPEGVPGFGRGGLTANPQLVPIWQKAFGRCTFPRWLLNPISPAPTPPEPIPTPPDPPTPTPNPQDPPVPTPTPTPTPTPEPEPLPIPVPDPPQPIPDPPPIPVPVPPDEADTMRPPAVTVDRWTLDELLNGREMAVHDRENPELGYRFRVFVKDGSVHAEITNNAGSAQTGSRRPVKTGGSQPSPQPNPQPQPTPQPSPGGGITLKTVNGFFLTVVDGLLRSSTQPSGFTFEQHGDKWALKVNGRYLRAVDGGGKELLTDRDEVGSHELFTVFKTGDAVAIQTMTGHFISAIDGGNGEVKANQRLVGGWESFISSRPFDQAPTRAALQGRIRAEGRFLVNDAGTFRPLFVSAFGCLTQLREGREGECIAYLDWAAATGFNGIRIFGGALSWQGQTAPAAREHLPRLLALARERGLYVENSVITDSGTGYNVREHLDTSAQICADAGNTIIEVANEPYHGTQASDVHDFAFLARLGRELCAPRGLTWASGAWETDEPLPSEVNIEGDFITLHLDRGRDEWNMVRRIRELEAASANYNRFVMNNEPIGWFETDVPGRRESNPQIAFTMGVLCRGFEVGMVSHADHALTSSMPGPVQQACHEAVVRGFRSIPSEGRLAFRNAGWGGADVPVSSANFDRVVRAYSFLESGNRGWTVLLGITGDPAVQWGNGWRVVNTLADEGQVRVLQIERN